MKIIISPHATRTPDTPTPRTADMAALVEAHKRAGLYPRPVPAAYTLGDTILVHPVLHRAMMEKITEKGREIAAEMDRNLMHIVRGF